MSNEKTRRKLNQDLLSFLVEDDAAALIAKLQSILTPAELADLPNRLAIIKQLKAGVPQQKIAANLGVGVATVTRGATALKQGQFSDVSAYTKAEIDRLWPSWA